MKLRRAYVAGLAGLTLLAGCSTPGASPLPTLGPSFTMPATTIPDAMTPRECAARGGDQSTVMACMAPYLEAMYAQVYAPLVTQRGVEWAPPKLVYPTADQGAQTACGAVTRPAYCPDDATVVLPLTRITEYADSGADLLLRIRETWVDGDVMYRYVDVPEDELRSSSPFGLVTAFAHEYAHHVQTLTGGLDRIEYLADEDPDNQNAYLSTLELHADCLSGWATNVASTDTLDDAQEFGVVAVMIAIGDDYGALAARETPSDPLTYQHGSIEERTQAYLAGYRSADTAQDPFALCIDTVKPVLKERLDGNGGNTPE